MTILNQEEEMRSTLLQEEEKYQEARKAEEKSQNELNQIQSEVDVISQDYETKAQLYKNISGGVNISQIDREIFEKKT